jgi:amino-acid N-acetyltransferase
MKNEYVIKKSEVIDEIIMLLSQCKLPVSDLISSKVNFLVAIKKDKIIACVGLQKVNTKNMLLRSLAVKNEYKNMGVGNDLITQLIKISAQKKFKTIHLLTTTADIYFEKKGFMISERNNAPKKVLQTTEFSKICPSTATYMTMNLEENKTETVTN